MIRLKLLLVVLVAVAVCLTTGTPAIAQDDASLLLEAVDAIDADDQSRYDELATVLVANDQLPETVLDALQQRNLEILVLGATLLPLQDTELYEQAIDVIGREFDVIPSARPEPGAAREPIPQPPTDLALAQSLDLEGLITLQLLDARGLQVPDSARQVLELAPRPGSSLNPPRPVTFETARRELRELQPLSTTSGLSGWILAVAGVGVAGLLVALATRSRRIARLAELAATDGLTGLNNRRQLDEDLAIQGKNGSQPTALLMIDVDHFSQFNLEHGHTVGDEALRQVAQAISSSVRDDDLAYRYGGEEFCVLLPNTDEATAGVVADRLRLAIQSIDINGTVVTASVGVASGQATDVAQITIDADSALYSAKESGRNQVALATKLAI